MIVHDRATWLQITSRLSTPPRVLVTGSRYWQGEAAVRAELWLFPPGTIVIHGNCEGADRAADRAARQMGLEVRPYPAQRRRFGAAAGPIRNQQMLDAEHPNLAIAFHQDLDDASAGTKAMVDRLERIGTPIRLVCSGLSIHTRPSTMFERIADVLLTQGPSRTEHIHARLLPQRRPQVASVDRTMWRYRHAGLVISNDGEWRLTGEGIRLALRDRDECGGITTSRGKTTWRG